MAIIIGPKKVVVSGNRAGDSPARIVECVSEYIFLISKNKQTSKKTKQNKNTKKAK